MDLALAHQNLILCVSALKTDTRLTSNPVCLLDDVAASRLVKKDLNVLVRFVNSNLKFYHNFYLLLT